MILYKKRKKGGKKVSYSAIFLQRGVFQEPINHVVGGLPVYIYFRNLWEKSSIQMPNFHLKHIKLSDLCKEKTFGVNIYVILSFGNL